MRVNHFLIQAIFHRIVLQLLLYASCRDALAKAIENYVTDRIKDRDDIDMKRIFITDSGVDAEIVENVEQLLRRYAGFEEIHHTLAGSTISGHCGPGCLGILYYNK